MVAVLFDLPQAERNAEHLGTLIFTQVDYCVPLQITVLFVYLSLF